MKIERSVLLGVIGYVVLIFMLPWQIWVVLFLLALAYMEFEKEVDYEKEGLTKLGRKW